MEKSLRRAMKVDNISEEISTTGAAIIVRKSNLLPMLTESAEKIDTKDADLHLKEIFVNELGKAVDELAMSDFLIAISSH